MRQQYIDLYNRLQALYKQSEGFWPAYLEGASQRLRGCNPKWASLDDNEVRERAYRYLQLWQIDCAVRPHKEALAESVRINRQETNAIRYQLHRMAKTLLPEPGEEWHKLKTVYSSTYHTQGFGAESYARRNAEMHAAEAQALGVEAEVRTVQPPPQTSMGSTYTPGRHFEVWVKVAGPVDLDLIARAPGMSLRDFLKACWSKGVNPRVYNPFLPQGLEAKLGIDYYGRDIDSQCTGA